MDAPFHQFSDLFAQLGLPSDESDIRAFIAKHSPLPQNVELWDAAFWTPAQASLLRDQKAFNDATIGRTCHVLVERAGRHGG